MHSCAGLYSRPLCRNPFLPANGCPVTLTFGTALIRSDNSTASHPVKSQFAVQAHGNSRKYCQDACLPKRLHRRPSGRTDPSWISDNSGVFRPFCSFCAGFVFPYSLFASFPFCILIIPSPQALSTSSLGKHSKTRLSAAQKKILPSRTHYPACPSVPRLCLFCRPHATRDVILSSLSPANP